MSMLTKPAPKGLLLRALMKKKKKKLHSQRKLSLHQVRKRRHIGSKSRESPSPEDERGVNVDRVAFWLHAAPGHQ
eukprot:488815-Pelagomonas_calceolata.AAC.1